MTTPVAGLFVYSVGCWLFIPVVFTPGFSYRNPLSMKSFSQALESILREYRLNYLKRRTETGIQANFDLTDESNTGWLPKCYDPAAV